MISKRKPKPVIRESYEYIYLSQRFRELGGNDDQVDAFCEWYGTKSGYKEYQKSKYIVALFGIPFEAVERVANGHQYEPMRIEALCSAAYLSIQSSGSTYATLSQLIHRCWAIERRAGVYEKTSALLLGASIQKQFKIDGVKIYSPYMWKLEKSIAKSIKKICRTAPTTTISPEQISSIEHELHIEYDDTQRDAFGILSHPIGVLTGGPGTGKTTLIRGLILAHEQTGRPLVLCAPTGKAAQQIRLATGRRAETIHKTLSIRPYMLGGYTAEEGSIPDGALVIVDEASMLDTEIAECLVRAAADAQAQILFVGDADQLESVGAGSVFRDLVLYFPVVRLDTIHRNAGTIAKNAHFIKTGDWGKLIRDKSFITANLPTSDEIVKNALAIHQAKYSPAAPHDVKIFTPVKSPQYITSTAKINSALHTLYHSQDKALKVGDKLFSVGEPVIITRNDYDLGLLNGDEGVVVGISENLLRVRVGDETVDISDEALQYVELGYAVTVHKAQGSSCKMAIILLPSEPVCMVTRRLAYVAVTRAEKRVVILHECYSLEMAIMDENTRPRQTGLIERLGDEHV